METRLDTFNGWKMRAAVESRLTSKGEAKYYIVEPITYAEHSGGIPRTEAEVRGQGGPFDSSDEAFSAAFKRCRHAIASAIRLRNLESFR
ncbi:hypothetical protein [Paraburkholderia silvatlantica]|uniref:Uncharacterized protein n=1 Tax=Paraburkholderia silvatlantica TaxID=321895 RepID=A0ABR6FFW7_9BURK|nr:hypothetical protein [Paraburkholderia silvatlantica]MBB2926317.1 hypothetical protein [Paraburkholderia silvatlantica]PVY26869.1 hypothetical protein C7411_122143 [Paraburkholderia silvatlantica]PXW33156.1 hypothetical protein C7413_121143 [Paraburkholderia silvatlantica]TDQ72106.1 hypothetical protein C7412_15219 [Paraburkholderia silvatlantica]